MQGFSENASERARLRWLTTFLLIFLVLVLAVLQFRWLQQIADANRSQSRAALRTAVNRFAGDFDQQLVGLLVAVRGGRLSRDAQDVSAAVMAALHRWQETTEHPELVKEAWLVDLQGTRRLDLGAETETVEPLPSDWRQPLAPWMAKLSSPEPGSDIPNILMAELPGLVVPLFAGRSSSDEGARPVGSPRADGDRRDRPRTSRRRHDRHHPPARRSRGLAPPAALLIIPLDHQALFSSLLPALAERHFGATLPYRLTLKADDGGGEPIFTWGPEPTGPAAAEVEATLFGPLRSPEGSSRLARVLPWPAPHEAQRPGQWRLEAHHPEGSLDRALERIRRRNSAVALGILAILAGALVLLTRNVANARRLARQQLDFVAGITHEIMTPVSALRSAGQNLAEGVVADADQVARYGNMIDREAGRLGDLVSQVLEFARMQSARPRAQLEALDPRAVVQSAVERSRVQLEAANVELELDLPDALPAVRGDRRGLIGSLHNLIINGIKYGQTKACSETKGWLGVRCLAESGRVRFEVGDRGSGISQEQQERIFEPFFRGADHAAGAIPGSGLGLALVRHWITAQGGNVSVSSTPGQGSTFILSLPIADREHHSRTST